MKIIVLCQIVETYFVHIKDQNIKARQYESSQVFLFLELLQEN